MELSQINEYLLYQFKSEDELVNLIHLMSENFTTKREKINKYVEDEKFISAYTSFYLTTNYPKLDYVLNLIKKDILDFKDFEFVDIGSGPGTFTLAILNHLPEAKIFSIEKSEGMRKQATKLVNGLYPQNNVQIIENNFKLPEKNKNRIGIFGHSANEMEVSDVLNLIKKLNLDEILFIEPGTKDFFKKSKLIREALLLEKYKIHYPCPAQVPCPLSEHDWCHQYIKIKLPEDVQRLTQLAKKDRSLLPLTIHYYAKEEINHSINRVIRSYGESKFALEWDICHISEHNHSVFKLQQFKRGMSKKDIKKLSRILSGEEIEYIIDKELENNLKRGKIIGSKE